MSYALKEISEDAYNKAIDQLVEMFQEGIDIIETLKDVKPVPNENEDDYDIMNESLKISGPRIDEFPSRGWTPPKSTKQTIERHDHSFDSDIEVIDYRFTFAESISRSQFQKFCEYHHYPMRNINQKGCKLYFQAIMSDYGDNGNLWICRFHRKKSETSDSSLKDILPSWPQEKW